MLKRAILSSDDSKRVIAATKCIVSIGKEECLLILEKLINTLSIEGLTCMARELAKSPLEKSTELLWSLLDKAEIYDEVIHSLSAKGDAVIPTCVRVIQNEKGIEKKISAAVKVLCLVQNPKSLPFLIEFRRTVSPSLAYSILKNIKESFFAGRDLPDSVFEGSRINSLYPRYFKRMFDLVVSSILMILFAPVLMLFGFLTKLDSPGPVIFRQERAGWKKETFNLFKFRTMVKYTESEGPIWASTHDARITSIGRFLRRTRLDELPQLLNVIRGEMSLVGPRPERPSFFDQRSIELPFYKARAHLRPGLTGLAQVEYTYGASRGEDVFLRLTYDLHYVLCCSFWLDLKILGKTLLKGTMGRY